MGARPAAGRLARGTLKDGGAARRIIRRAAPLLLAGHAFAGTVTPWRQVHPAWSDAYVSSFRSPDLVGEEPDECWGRGDGRMASGGVITELPAWLDAQSPAVDSARQAGRPILLSLHCHSGFGTGLVTYAPDLGSAEVANHPWLVRRLLERGLGAEDVTVVIDTCNVHATAAHQLRPDLVPESVAAWPPFVTWRRSHPEARELDVAEAHALFARDRVARELAPERRGCSECVHSVPFVPLTAEERAAFGGRLLGQRGVILGTPALFNVLRLGPEPSGTLTADLLAARLDPRLDPGHLSLNKRDFALFDEFAFLEAAGPGPWALPRMQALVQVAELADVEAAPSAPRVAPSGVRLRVLGPRSTRK